MRRADRLFLVIHALRGRRRALPARELAQSLGVSLRTVYRDVADLQVSGVPIEGEAGVGYVLRKGADLPPLMFTAEELEALVVGTRFVRAFAGSRLAAGAQAALLKIQAVLPEHLRTQSDRTPILAPVWRDHHQSEFIAMIDRLHHAIDARTVLGLRYADQDGRESRRDVEPLCLAFWGGKWTLGTWCRLREDFRNFRPDRILDVEPTGETFTERPGHDLDAYLAAVRHPRAALNE